MVFSNIVAWFQLLIDKMGIHKMKNEKNEKSENQLLCSFLYFFLLLSVTIIVNTIRHLKYFFVGCFIFHFSKFAFLFVFNTIFHIYFFILFSFYNYITYALNIDSNCDNVCQSKQRFIIVIKMIKFVVMILELFLRQSYWFMVWAHSFEIHANVELFYDEIDKQFWI